MPQEPERNRKGEIAIVGIGCQLPPDLGDMQSLWRFLCRKGDATTDIPADRWSIRRFYDASDRTPGKTYMRRGSFLKRDITGFDPLFFGISPREAAVMDPQQRLLLEVTWEALEDGGFIASELAGTRTGVFVGTFSQDYLIHSGSPLVRSVIKDHFAATAASATMLSGRLSYVFGLQGPSMSIDTACSSSLVALHNACNSLRLGESDLALTGGVNVMFNPQVAMLMAKGHFLARDGRSKSFDAAADGYGRGEGCAMVVLKRLEDAVRDGNHIHGVICASGVNQDGRTPALTMPDTQAQESLIREVAGKAGIPLSSINYVEAHGTGTPVGDPIEAKAIWQAIGQQKSKDDPVPVGSIKANLGHMEAAAGIVGVLKTVLCLQKRAVPPQANLTTLNPNIPFEDWHLTVPKDELLALPAEGPLYAAVNSFGYGGTNAMALLRAPTAEESAAGAAPSLENGVRPEGLLGLQPLLLTAFSENSLKAQAARYAALLRDPDAPSLEDFCFSALRYRSRFRNRAFLLAQTPEEMAERLDALAAGEGHKAVFLGQAVVDRPVQPVFVFSGMGPQWWGMGRYLIEEAPAPVRDLARRCDALFAAQAGWSLIGELRRPEAESRINETAIAQPSIFLVQICLAELFGLFGVEPSAIIGHSVGEVAAAYVSGALSLEDAVAVIFHRSRLQARLEGRGTMLAVGLSAEDAQDLIGEHREAVSVAAVNAARSCTLAGEKAALEELSKLCEKRGVFNRFLKVGVPYHSQAMEEIQSDMLSSLASLKPRPARIPVYSTVTGKRMGKKTRHDAQYWYRNARQVVRFSDAMRAMLEEGYAVFLEIGAHPVLGGSIREIGAENRFSVAVLHSQHRKEEGRNSFITAMARLALSGGEPDWSRLVAGRRVRLPGYAWSRDESFWPMHEADRRDRLDVAVHPILGTPGLQSGKYWQADISLNYMPWLPDHRIDGVTLLPAAAYVEAALAAHNQLEGRAPSILESLEIDAPLILEEGVVPVMSWTFDEPSRVLSFSSENVERDGNWHYHGKVSILSSRPWPREEVDVRSLHEGLGEPVSGDALYPVLEANGFSYGPAFRTLRTLYRGQERAVGNVQLSETEAAQIDEYFMHPALLDGALHVAVGLCPMDPQGDRVFVPTSIRRFSYLGEKAARAVVCATLREQTEKYVETDLALYSESGALLAEIQGLRCVVLPRAGRDETARISRLLYTPSWVQTERNPLFAEPYRLSVVGDGGGLLEALKSVLGPNGVDIQAQAAFSENDYAAFCVQPDFMASRSVVYLCPALEGRHEQGVAVIRDLLALVNAIPVREKTQPGPRFVVVTRGASDAGGEGGIVDPMQAAIAGFMRGVEAERPDLRVKTVDFPAVFPEGMLEDLGAEILLDDVQEDEVTLYDGKRFALRLVSAGLTAEAQPVPFRSRKDEFGISLLPSPSGALDKLGWQEFEVGKAGPGQVLFRTLAVGLNFKDILKAMSLVPDMVVDGTFHGHHIGAEAAVEVMAVGKGVTRFKAGERHLVSYPGCFVSHAVIEEEKVYSIPLERVGVSSPEEAAVLLLVSMTAYHGLCRLAQLRKGETVLIHAGTGGVGLAAIQMAKSIGAVIYATAGSEEKRAYLRELGCAGVWNSRSLEFVDGVRQATGGKGVDVVLNSLPGEALVQSLGLLAPYGRFVEIGKKDIVEHHRIALTPFNRNLSFFAMDLDRIMVERPELPHAILDDLEKMARAGELLPLPFTAYKAAEVAEGFKFLASTKHIGKVAISFDDLSDVLAYPIRRSHPGVVKEASYLVTGAFGGFGLKTAQWLVHQGASCLHLIGRNAPREEASRWIEAVRAQGVRIDIHILDMIREDDVVALVSSLKKGKHPLRGVFHAAGVLEDGLLHTLDPDSVARVLGPKLMGAYALDKATQNMALDYFVLYSSFTVRLGNIGQSAYMAANGGLDGLAVSRRQRGLPALSVNWGAIGDVGMLARHATASRTFEALGVSTMTADDALALLPRLIERDAPTIAVVDIDWNRWFAAMPELDNLARFGAIGRGSGADGLSETLVALFGLPENERLGFVLGRLKGQLSAVLQMEPDAIDDTARLSELGIDSLAGVELQMSIRNEFGVEIPLLILARNETVVDMARLLLRQAGTVQGRKVPLAVADA